MLVNCPECNHKARIAAAHKINHETKNLYCQCLDAVFCGCTFVLVLSLSHEIKPIKSIN